MAKHIKLTAKHEHAGREYPPGAKLTLDDDQADWLIALGRAELVSVEATDAAPVPKPAKA